MTDVPRFDYYDERVATAMVEAGDRMTGLPKYLGLHTTGVGPGRLEVLVDVRDELLTPIGNMHGGVLAAIVDHCLGSVMYPLMPRGSWAATTEFKLNYLAPVTKGQLEAIAEVLSMTRRTSVVRIDVRNEGRLVCTAQGTCILAEPKHQSAADRQ